ncbi:SapC family protein [uncultured Thiocystis sp.]|jgi:hypothetical protein|uniref:SapC family protein n=1 Tax=uncultured Thiocystis sp. TaxID=1202134 RepID=UPI002600975C|nr:SapC family protein [uncultured Thiocystis sp.]
MPTIVAVSRERHADKRWKRYVSHAFASQSSLAPLVAAEIPKAAMAMPLAFVRQGDDYVPVALMGLEPARNLLVAPDGRWLGRYVPSVLRGYPFSLLKTQDNTLVLCIDEDSGLVANGHEGEPFFNATGEPADSLNQIMDFLQQIEKNRALTAIACGALARHALIRPWPITLKGESGERQLEGIFQVDEAALNQLPDDAFLNLRQAAALPIVYCQLLSMQHLAMLGELAAVKAPTPALSKSASGFVLQDDDLLQFDWDRFSAR